MTDKFDPMVAYGYGACVEATYRLFKAGVLDPVTPGTPLPAGWRLLTVLTAVDHVALKTEPEFFGLVLQSTTGPQVLVAIRGTDTLLEWLVDAEFKPVPLPGEPNAGHVEDGFCSVYSSMQCVGSGGAPLAFISQLPADTPLIIAGHSLGAAVATLLALDLSVNLPGRDLTLYTYASPRVGDATFAAFCGAKVTTHFRIVNVCDIVPKLPPAYDPTGTEIDLDSKNYPQIVHKLDCYHTLTTYLWLLDQQSAFGLGVCQSSAPAAGSGPSS